MAGPAVYGIQGVHGTPAHLPMAPDISITAPDSPHPPPAWQRPGRLKSCLGAAYGPANSAATFSTFGMFVVLMQ